MKRLVYLFVIVMMLSLGGIVSADQRGCDSNGKANTQSKEVRGCDTNEDNTSSNGQAANHAASNSSHASSNGQAANHAASNSSHASSNEQAASHAAQANNTASNSSIPAGAGCQGLENAFSHISDDSPAWLILLRNLVLHGCDDDGDGVPNVSDQCPDTAVGVEVGEDGCPNADSDNDGVPDVNNDGSPNDQCPDTPEGVEVDETGCPLGQPDLIITIADEVPANSCTADGCTLIVNFTVTNIGDEDVLSDFDVSGDASPTGMNTVSVMGGLAAGASVAGSIDFGPGQNCFDPDCAVALTVDSGAVVAESNEANNTDDGFWLG